MLYRDLYVVISAFLGSVHTIKSLDRLCTESSGLIAERENINLIFIEHRHLRRLKLACMFGYSDVYEYLLERDKCVYHGGKLLIKACKYGRLNIIKLIYDKQLSTTYYERNTIIAAAINGRLEVVKLLLSINPEYKKYLHEAVYDACACGRTNILKEYIDVAMTTCKIIFNCIKHDRLVEAKIILDAMTWPYSWDDLVEICNKISSVDKFIKVLELVDIKIIEEKYKYLLTSCYAHGDTIEKLAYLRKRTGMSIAPALGNIYGISRMPVIEYIINTEIKNTKQACDVFHDICKQISLFMVDHLYKRFKLPEKFVAWCMYDAIENCGCVQLIEVASQNNIDYMCFDQRSFNTFDVSKLPELLELLDHHD